MANPAIADQPLSITGSTFSGGRWLAEFNSPIGFSLLIDSSGNDTPFVDVRINWGDGEVDLYRNLVTGFYHPFSHLYPTTGDYVLTVTAINQNGEVSNQSPNQTASIYVLRERDRQRPLSRWSGPVLRQENIGYAFDAAQQIMPVVYELAGSHKSGGDAIQVKTNDSIQSGSEFILSQPGKLLTAGRIIKSDLNILIIDTTLNDDYGPTAKVEISMRQSRLPSYASISSPQPTGFRIASDGELVKSSLLILMGTRVGERLFNPTSGSRLHELMFEPNDVVTAQKAFKFTLESVADEPRVVIQKSRYESVGHETSVMVAYSLKGAEEETFEVTIPLGRITA